MVESKADVGFTFDDLMAQRGTDEDQEVEHIRQKQGSCFVKDLNSKIQTQNQYGYVAPKVSLQQAMMVDIHDEVLAKQKEQLLGNMNQKARASMAVAMQPLVEFQHIEIECPDRPQGNIIVNLENQEENDTPLNKLVKQEYTLKEGTWTRMKVKFKVHNTVVLGLKICSSVDTKLKLFKDEEVLGTYAPTVESHEVETDWAMTPKGFFQRGTYEGNIYFADADEIVHLLYDFKISIKKDW